MASSIRKAQSPLCCQLCENPNAIKWKCMDCKLLMCDNCKERIHPRFKLSEAHSVISIKDVGKNEGDISDQFGSISISQQVVSSVVSTYTTEFPSVGKMQYSGNDTVYCSYLLDDKSQGFYNIRLMKKSIKILQNFHHKCMDFALDVKDEIYFVQSCSELKSVSTDGVTKTVLNTSPMIILGTHINKDNEILLGLREQGSPFPVTKFCNRQIAVFDVNNKRKLTIEFDQKGEKLFSYVWRISTDSYNNIYAIDQFENYDGRLVSVDKSGDAKFTYEGHSSVNTSQTPFNPFDIVITKTNIIIICDKSNNCLHALNTKGDLIGLQNLTDLGVELPGSLCLDSEGFLLIGCYTWADKPNNAKIHVAEIAF